MSASILVLEDDPQLREILTQVLTDDGFEVVAVDRGELAVQQARDRKFDLIVADIRMEGMGGLAAIEQTKAAQPAIGTMVVSAYSDPDETERAEQLDVGAYLRKPFRMKEFLFQVRRQLEKRVQGPLAHEASAGKSGPLDLVEICLEQLSTLIEESKRLWLQRTKELTANLGKELELAVQVQREIATACCYLLYHGTSLDLEQWDGPAQQMATFRSVLLMWEEPAESATPPPIEARLAALILAAVPSEADPASPWSVKQFEDTERGVSQILERHPQLDRALVELYLTKKGEETVVSAPQPTGNQEKARFLLTLAQTLETSGNSADAIRAYESVSQTNDGREAVKANLSLARLQGSSFDVALLERAYKGASRLGPVLGAYTALEAGQIAFNHAPDLAKDLLSKAAQSLEALGFENALARAAIPLIALGTELPPKRYPRLVRALLSKVEREDTLREAAWLFPLLLHHLPKEPSKELLDELGLLIEGFPKVFAHAYSDGMLGDEEKALILSIFSSDTRQPPQELLSLLVEDPDRELSSAARSAFGDSLERSAVPTIRVRSFGEFEVYIGEEKLAKDDWKTQKNKHLFAFLAARWGKAIPEENVRETFWPANLDRGKKRVYWATSVIRGCFKAVPSKYFLARNQDALRLNPDIVRWHDLEEFTKLVARAKKLDEAEDNRAQAIYRRLIQIKKGPYLEGVYSDWAVRFRDSLERQLIDSLVRLGQLASESKDYRESLEASLNALQRDPCRQEAALTAMESYVELGQPNKALEIFEKTERHLRVDYDLEPSTALLKMRFRATLGKDESTSQLIG